MRWCGWESSDQAVSVFLLAIFLVCPVFADYSPAGPNEELFYRPVHKLGGDISAWMSNVGSPDDFAVASGCVNPHTGEPVILVTLNYPGVQAVFWLNAAQGDSNLLKISTGSLAFIESLGLPFAVNDPASWSVLGEPIEEDASSIRFRDCGDHLCSSLQINSDRGSFSSLVWTWDID